MTATKVAVVTGASAGLGRAIAVAFAEEGFDVALAARGGTGLQGAADDVERRNQRALVIPPTSRSGTTSTRQPARWRTSWGRSTCG
jgi:NADP-dependent 3-hydroxy acid dehydrogenase YdfG